MPHSSNQDPHPLANPSKAQLSEEEFSLEELQTELQRLQYELQEHGRSLFGGELPNQTGPAVVEVPTTAPSQWLKSHQPPFYETQTTEDKDRSTLDIQSTADKSMKQHNNRTISKNERNLKVEIKRLQKQLASEREELHRLRALKSVTEEKMASRMAELEGRLIILLQNEKKIEKRRAADAEGWRAEFTALRHQLQSIEHRQRKLLVARSIKDEDHRETVLARHRKLEKLHHKGASAASAAAQKKKKKTSTRKSAAASNSFGGAQQAFYLHLCILSY